MAKDIRPLQRYNENTEQTEIFYPATTTDAIADVDREQSLTETLEDTAFVGEVVGDPTGDWDKGEAEDYIDEEIAKVKNWVSNTPVTNVVTVSSLPASGNVNTLYRVAGTNTYSEYGWDGTRFVKLAEKEYGIDDEPTAGSDNLVKSGGVYNGIDYLRSSINTHEVSLQKTINAGVKGYIDRNGAINTGDLSHFSSVVYDISGILDKRIHVTTPFTDNVYAKVWGLVLDDEETVIATGELVSETSEGDINLFDYNYPNLKYIYVSVQTNHPETTAVYYTPDYISLENLKQTLGNGENDVISQKVISEKFEETDSRFRHVNSKLNSGVYDISKLVVFRASYYINGTNGVESSAVSNMYCASDYIDMSCVNSIRMSVPKYTVTTKFGYAFYDKNKNYISGGNFGNKNEEGIEIKELSVPATAIFLRTTYWTEAYSSYEEFFLETTTNGVIEQLDDLDETRFFIKGEYNVTDYIKFTTNRYVDALTGVVTSAGGGAASPYTASDYIELNGADSINVKIPTFNSQSTTWGYAFYDKNKNYIIGVPCRGTVNGTTEAVIPVPYNAVYYRTTYWKSTTDYYTEYYCILVCSGVNEKIIGINEKIIDIEGKVYGGSSALFKASDDSGDCIGWNHHANHDALEPYTTEMIKYIRNSGSNFVRCTILKKDEQNNEVLIPELYDYAMAGIEVLTSCDSGKNINTIKANARIILENCDGITVINDGTHTFRYNVKYIYCMNESFGNYPSSDPARIAADFAIYKEFYNFVHSLRNDVKVLAGGLLVNDLYFSDMCAYVDDEGKHFWDYIDIFDFHLYPSSPNGFISSCNTLKSIMDNSYNYSNSKNFIDVPVWVSEFGFPSYNFGIAKESAYLASSIILAFALGIEKMLVFRLCGVEDFRNIYYTAPREAFFGLVHKSLENSYISFLRNDGIYQQSIDAGDCYYKLYLDGINTPFVSLSSISTAILNTILTEGLVVSGAGYTIERVSIINRASEEEINIYNEDKVIDTMSDKLILSSSLFNNVPFSGSSRNLAIGDSIMVYVKDIANTSGVWSGNRITDSYYVFKNIVRLLQKGSTIPTISDKGTYYKAQWKKPNGRDVYALWSKENTIEATVSIDGNAEVYNVIGEKQNVENGDTINLSISPMYFENCVDVNLE